MVEINSFYGNQHTDKTVFKEILKDLFRSRALRSILVPDFYTPEVCGRSFDSDNNPIADGSLQLILRRRKNVDFKPRWDIFLQEKQYKAGSDWKGIPLNVDETLVAQGLTMLQAFNRALDEFAKIKWHDNRYYYARCVREDAEPVMVSDEETPQRSIFWMPAFEELHLGTSRLAERRTEVLHKLREKKKGAPTLRAESA